MKKRSNSHKQPLVTSMLIAIVFVLSIWSALGEAGKTLVYSNAVSLNLSDINASPVIAQGATASLAFAEDDGAQSLTLTATDDDADVLTWSVSTAASQGSATVDNNGLVNYAPNADENGEDSFVVTVSDGSGGTDSIAVAVTITAVNDAPILPLCQDVSVAEDGGAQSMLDWAKATAGPTNEAEQELTFHVTVDSNAALFALGGEPAVSAEGTLTFTPALNASGIATLSLYATDDADGADTSETRTFAIEVTEVNDSPVNTVLPSLGGTCKVGGTIDATQGTWNDDSDGNHGTLVYAIQWQSVTDDAGSNLQLLDTGDSMTLTAAQAHLYICAVVTITDTDDSGIATAQATSAWSLVDNGNPVITESSATIATVEDADASTITLHATDADADALTWSVSTPDKGIASVTDGSVTYTPNTDENGADHFTVTVSDGYDGSNSLDIDVTIDAVNDAPTFTVGNDVSVAEDCGAQTVTNWVAAQSVGADNETDQTLTYTVTSNTNDSLFATDGAPVVSALGSLSFTPVLNASGVSTITLQVADDGTSPMTSAEQTFDITVTAVNDAPVNTALPTVSGTYAVDGALVATAGTWSDDADGNLGTLTYAWQWQSATDDAGTGLQTLGTGDRYTLTDAASHRYVRALVTATDTDTSGSATAQAASAWVFVENTAPVIVETEASLTTEEDTANSLTLHATDADSDTLTWSASTPAIGTATVVNGVVTYTPNKDENGTDAFSVTVTDGYSGTATLDIAVTVTSVNDKPTFTIGDHQTVWEDCGTQTITDWVKATSTGAANESTQTLAFSVTANTNTNLFTLDGAPAVSPDGTLTYTPVPDANGIATVTLCITDNGNGADTSATQSFTITVMPINDQPSFTKGADQTIAEDCGTVTVADWVVAKSAGPDDEGTQTLTFHTSNDNTALFTAGGQPTVAQNGTLTYTPAPDANGDATVTLYVTDNGGTANTGDDDTSSSQTFTISVAPVNDVPSFTVGDNVTVAEDCGTQTVHDWIKAKSAGPSNESAQPLTFTVTDNTNTALFADGGAPAVAMDGTLTYTPAQNANGSATLTLEVSDNGGGTQTSATQTFTITVTPVNDMPVITGDAAFTTDEDIAYAYAFTVSDVEDASGTLTLAYSTGNTALLKKTNMVLTGSDANRTLTVTPEPDRSGTVNITLTVTDSLGSTATKTIAMTIAPTNDAPTISTIANRTTEEDTSTGVIGFTIADVDTDVATCTVTAVSDNPTLVANTEAAIVLGGSGASRTVALTPSLNQYGTANITVTVSDGSLTANTTFTLTVSPVNDAPTLTAIAPVTINEDTVTPPIAFTVTDVDSPLSEITVSAATNNTAMIPRTNIVLSSIAADGTCTLTLTPVANSNGTATMSVTVKDAGGKLSTQTFVLTVSPVNDAPVLSAINAQSTNEDTAKTITVTVSDIDNTTEQLTLTATDSTNATLLPLSGINVPASTGSSRSVTMTPEADQYGATGITLTLTDTAGGTTSRTFTLTVASVNDKPTFTAGTNVTVDEDCGAYTFEGWATDISTGATNEAQTLTFTVRTDNDALFATLPTLDTTSGDLTFTPAPDACGVVNITAKLSDSGDAESDTVSFTITITPINDAPVAQSLSSGLNTDEDQQLSGNLRATDVDKDTLTYELVSGNDHNVLALTTPHGTVTLNPTTGTFVYVPSKDYYNGLETFDFRVFDGTVYSNDATVTIDFTGINDPPIATDSTVTVAEDATDFSASLAANVSDVDNTTLTYAVVTNPQKGGTLVLDTATGAYTYQPAPDFNGIDRFTFRVYDGHLYSNTATVTLNVTAVNDAPIPKNDTVAIDEGQTLNGLFKATDVELDTITYALATNPAPDGFSFTDSATGNFTYTPPFATGTVGRSVTVDFTATDANGASATGTITIAVRSVNLPPVRAAGSPAAYVATEDIPLTGNLNVTDPNGDALTYTVLSPVRYGTLSAIDANGNFTYTSTTNFSGTDRFTFMATDPKGLCSSIYTAQIVVTGVNDAPVAYDEYYYTSMGVPITDIIPVGYDVDGNSLTFEIASNPVSGVATAIKKTDGTFTYTPNAGYSGNDSFTYKAYDVYGGVSAAATIHIHVYGTGGSGGSAFNYIPNQSTPENTSINVALSVTDMTITAVTATSSNQWLLTNAGITVSADKNSITLTPNAYRTGQTVITVTVTDSATPGNRYVRTFILTVTRVNYAPTGYDLARTMDENTEMFEFVTAHDYNGDALTFAQATPCKHGTVEMDINGTFHYKPNTNYFGEDSFTYTVSDSVTTSAEATVTITVTQVPVAPIADSASFTTAEDTAYEGQLTGTEPNKGALVYYLVQNGHRGSVTVAEDGQFTYTPNVNESGSDAFTFKTKGPGGLFSAVAKISITIQPVNDVPTMVYKNYTAFEDMAVSGYLEATDADEGDTLTFELVPTQGDLALGTLTLDSATGFFTYTPTNNLNGTDHFSILVKDSSSSSPPMVLSVTIAPLNDAPVAKNVAIAVTEDSLVTDNVTAFYSDADGDVQTFSVVQSPTKGTIVFTTDGTYTYTPNANENGTDYFTFRTRDSGGLSSNVALATVTITPINDTPTLVADSTWAINEDSKDQIFYFTVGDVEDSATVLTVSGTKDIAAIASLSFWGTGSSRWMKVTPVAHFQLTTDITITVTDTGKDGTLTGDVKTASTTVTVTVVPVNDTPTINGKDTNGSAITTAVTIDEDTHTDAIGFTVSDEETASSSLVITGESNNTALVPTSGIKFGGTDSARTVTVTPAADKYGSVRVTLYVSDGNTTRNAYVDVTVRPVNDAPIVKAPADQTIPEDGSTEILYYTISDIDSAVTAITMTATSSDESIVAASGITLSGNGAERTVAVKPVANANGDVTITLTADDHGSVNRYGSATFVVHVTPVNDAPTVQAILNQTIDEDTATAQIPVAIDDIDDAATTLTLSAVSGNPALIDASGITFGTNAETGERWMTLTPKVNANGSALITVKVTDVGGRSTQKSFTLTVLPVNDPPTITAIADQTILEDKATNTLTFTVADIDDDVVSLAVTGASANTTVIPTANIALAGSGAERTVKVTPAADQNGDVLVTLTVKDVGGLTADTTFTVHITPVNDKPTFTAGANQSVLEDCGIQTVADWATNISRGKPNEGAQKITFYVSNDNQALFTPQGQPAVDENGQLTYTPTANLNGTATVTLYAKDDGGTANSGADTSATYTFTITVLPVNDQPTFTDAGDITVVEDSLAYSAAWANQASIDVGPANETQTHTFAILNTTVTTLAGNTSLFSVVPAINAQTGAISFTPAANANGTARVTVVLKDPDGIANGGVDTSVEHTFTITVSALDDIPTFTLGSNITVNEDSGAYSKTTSFATGITPGGGTDESSQTLTFTLTGYTASLFETAPSMTSAGMLTFKPAANMNGVTTVTVTLSDGTNNIPKNFTITIRAVNDIPSFTMGTNQQVLEDCKVQSVTAWATNISTGPSNESAQTRAFTLSNNNTALFTAGGQPTVDTSGKLTYTPADNAFGTATVTITLKDSGGISNSGVDTTLAKTFTIEVLPVNDQPSFEDIGNVTVTEDSGAYNAAWAKSATVWVGPANETQTRVFTVKNYEVQSVAGNTSLFSVQPAINTQTGVLTFTPMENANGTATLTVVLSDLDGIANGGVDTSVEHTFTITVSAINDKPTFTLGAKVTVNEDSGAYSATCATGITTGGGTDESGQTLQFTLSGYNAALFAIEPTMNAAGQLTFTPAADAFGLTTVTVVLSDGSNTVSKTFQIEIVPINDMPVFTDAGDISVLEDSGAYSAAWANQASINVGPANETQTHTFVLVSNTVNSVAGNTNLFSTAPAINAQTGAISFTPAANANGVAEVTVKLTDADGTTNGGVDTSALHTFTITVQAVNDQPTFADGGDIRVDEDYGAYAAAWAVEDSILMGPNDEHTTRTFTITNTEIDTYTGNTKLFSVAPAIDAQTGAIAFTAMPNASGTVQLTVVLTDEDGTTNGGVDTSVEHTFTITVEAVNDDPTFTLGDTVTVNEDSGAYSKAYATDITPGGGTDEADQPLTFTLTGYQASLFAIAPTLTKAGLLTFTPATDLYGATDVTVTLSDGISSVTDTFQIVVLSVNDQPSFTKGANQQVLEDAGTQTITAWATDLRKGPSNESDQTLAFTLSNNNNALFTTAGQPVVDATGKLTYTPVENAYGIATVTLTLADNGGTDNHGVDTSDSATFTIKVLPVNDQPSFEGGGDITVEEDSGAYQAQWVKADSIYLGPDNESQTPSFSVDGITVVSVAGNTSLFSAVPTIDVRTGELSFTPASNANGTAEVTITLMDEDGTDNGGIDTSLTHTFTITINAVDDAPTFTTGGTVTLLEDSGAYDALYATNITAGGGTDEAGQKLTFTVSGYNAELFATVPALTASLTGDSGAVSAVAPHVTINGHLTFTPAADAYGDTDVIVTLSDGHTSVAKQFTISVLPVNDQPSFTPGGNIIVEEDSGAYAAAWADTASIVVGPANETQTHTFVRKDTKVTSLAGNTSLFSAGPAIDAQTGAISFTPAANANGVAEVTVVLTDADGTTNGGLDTSTEHTFTITVKAIDDKPTFATGGAVIVNEDSGLYDALYATGITTGGGTDETSQVLTITLSGYNTSLFSTVPTLSTGGRLKFQPGADAFGSTNVTVTASDGTNVVTGSFQITVQPVNDPPTFNAGADQQVLQNSVAQTVAGWATNLYRGPNNESGQTLSFTVSNNKNALFATGGQPAVNAAGQLTYTPASNAFGVATVSVMLADNGGTDNGGDNTSAARTFTITILPASNQTTTTLTVTALWNDSDNVDGLRPASVTVYLYNDVGVIRSQVLSQSNNWTYTFAELPMFNASGVPITYRVAEAAITGYHVAYENGTQTVTIQNTHITDPFTQSTTIALIDFAEYNLPLGANSNMNEGECFD